MGWSLDPELAIRVCVALIGGIGTAFYGLHIRRLKLAAAVGQLTQVQTDTIATVVSEAHSLRRQLEIAVRSKEGCEEELTKTKAAVAKWDNMLGRIWVDEFTESSE
jgi:ribosomal protein S13